MDTQTLAVLAAWAAAGVALTGAFFQFFIGRKLANAANTSSQAALMSVKNAGRHKIADFRQKWIDKVIDALSEYHSIIATPTTKKFSLDNQRKMAALRTRLEIYLNPAEDDTVTLLGLMDAIMESAGPEERAINERKMMQVAHQLLKKEWVRIKDELK